MTVRRADNGTIHLEGECPVEDAEPLLQMLLSTPDAALDWTKCEKPHTAVVQIVMAAGEAPAGPCGDAWIGQWWPALRGGRGEA